MPVGLILISALIGFIFHWSFPKISRVILGLTIVFLYFMSTSFGSYYLGKVAGITKSKHYPALSLADLPKIDPATTAIVVLSCCSKDNAPEYGGKSVINWYGLETLLYVARLHKKIKTTILLTGNSSSGGAKIADSELMHEILSVDFGLSEEILLETKSASTYENAKFSSRILSAHKIKTIILVTRGYHMPRAMEVFSQYPFKLIPAPIGPLSGKETDWSLYSFIPIVENLITSSSYWYQFLARTYYKLSGKLK